MGVISSGALHDVTDD